MLTGAVFRREHNKSKSPVKPLHRLGYGGVYPGACQLVAGMSARWWHGVATSARFQGRLIESMATFLVKVFGRPKASESLHHIGHERCSAYLSQADTNAPNQEG
jgi:hypothetical protein